MAKKIKKDSLTSLKQYGFTDEERAGIQSYIEKNDLTLSQLMRGVMRKHVLCSETSPLSTPC